MVYFFSVLSVIKRFLHFCIGVLGVCCMVLVAGLAFVGRCQELPHDGHSWLKPALQWAHYRPNVSPSTKSVVPLKTHIRGNKKINRKNITVQREERPKRARNRRRITKVRERTRWCSMVPELVCTAACDRQTIYYSP